MSSEVKSVGHREEEEEKKKKKKKKGGEGDFIAFHRSWRHHSMFITGVCCGLSHGTGITPSADRSSSCSSSSSGALEC
jgi:hypothetical protein